MVNEQTTYITVINGYEFIRMTDGSIYPDAIEFCLNSGKECEKGFLWEAQHQICNILIRNEQEDVLTRLFAKKLMSSQFEFVNIPPSLKFLLKSKKWFYKKINNCRKEHKDCKVCGGFASFLDSLYSEKSVPLITKKTMQFCPFCGVSLEKEFQTDEWWIKQGL